jgi:hypothetical protein
MAIVNWLIVALITSALATLNSSQKNSELFLAYFYSGFPISHAFFRDTRITKLLDLILFTRNYTIFNNWLV